MIRSNEARAVALCALVAVVVLAPNRSTNVASARVVMTPSIPRTCGKAESWEKVSKCLAKFGEPKVVRELPHVKLVVIASPRFAVPGLYLYRETGKRWLIAGMFETSGSFEVFGLSRPTIAHHTGFRFDIGVVEQGSGDTGKVIVQQKLSVFCAGTSYFCSAVMTSCDYFVDGRAHESFRGKLTIDGDTAKVTGDTSRSGAACVSTSEVTLDFAVAAATAPILRGEPVF